MIAISYRRDDSLPIAGRLYDRLQAKFGKRNVFMDFDSIPAGVDFREQIKQTIERANLVVAVIGPDWLGEQGGSRRIDDPADFVRLEIAYALNRGIPVIPLLVDETPMPKAEKLPPDIEALAFRNALPLDSGIDFHSHTDRLIVGIRRALSDARPRGQTNAPDSGQSAATWADRRRTIAIWCGSVLVCSLAIFALWRFVASGSAERAERERTLANDKALALTVTPYSNPSPTPPPITPEQSKSIPAQVAKPQVSRTPQPVTTVAPTPEPTLESRLIGKWQGPRHMIEYFPDHTFAQTGLKVDGMTWRLDGRNLTIVYPDLGKDFPAWYPESGPLTLKIVSLAGGELITENGAGLQFVEYRITVDTSDEREGAATRAKAATKKLQANQSERPSATATASPQSTAVPTVRPSAPPTSSPVVETSPSQTPAVTVTEPSNEKLARVYVAKIGLNVLLPTALFPDAAARLADEKTDHLNSVQGCADVFFRASRDSVKNVYETCIKEVAPQGSGKSIDYKVLKPTWFVVSGSSRRSGFYIKGVKHGNEVAVMQLEYIGALCNIPAPVLAEISQKFDGRSESTEVQTPVPFLPSPSPLNPNPQPSGTRLNYAQGKQTVKSVYIKAVGCNVLIPTDLFPNVRMVSESPGDGTVWEKNYQVGVSFEQNTLDFDWVYRFHSSGDDALYKIKKDSWWIVQLRGTSISGGDLPRPLNGMGRYIVAVKKRPDMFQMMTVWYREDHCLFTADTLKAMATSFGGKP